MDRNALILWIGGLAILSLGCLGAPSPDEGLTGGGYGFERDEPAQAFEPDAPPPWRDTPDGGLPPQDTPPPPDGHPEQRPEEEDRPERSNWSAGSALFVDDARIIAADGATGDLIVYDRLSFEPISRMALGGRPEQIIVNGNAVWATLYDTGEVVRVNLREGVVATRALVGAGAWGLARSEDGTRLYATAVMAGHVIALDPASLEARGSAGPFDQPRAVAVAATGVVVTTRGQNAVTLDTDESGDLIDAIDTPLRTIQNQAPGATPNLGLSIAIHPISGDPFVAHQISVVGTPESVEDSNNNNFYYSTFLIGTPFVAAVTKVDPAQAPNNTQVQREPARLVLPRAAVHHPTHHVLAVAGVASDSVELLDSRLDNPFDASYGIVGTGRGPKALAFSPDGDLIYVLNDLDGTIGVHDVRHLLRADGSRPDPYQTIDLRPNHSHIIEGQSLFTTNRISPGMGYNWSCSNCHFDGLSDGLTWTGPNGVRQTPALAGRLSGTGPYNWKGSEPTLFDNVSRTLGFLGGFANGQEIRALASYIETMPAPPAPERDEDAITRGRSVFQTAGCSACHSGGALTDGQLHDMGALSEAEARLETFLTQNGQREPEMDPSMIKTPSLIGLQHSAPYLHDGSAATLDEILDGTMPPTHPLDPQQRADLLTYLRSL